MTSHLVPNIQQTIIAGGAAGNLTVTGIKTRDKLVGVVGFTLAEGTPNTLTPLDLTDEFSITAADTINNAGGTASTGGVLIVTYLAAHALGGDLNRT